MKKESILCSGDDVIIIGQKDTIFENKDGTVKEINLSTKKAIIHFHPNYSYIFGYEYQQGITTHEFDFDDLEKVDLSLKDNITRKANRLFGKMYHSLYSLKYSFSNNNECMHKECNNQASKRILYNCWGTVCEYDVCIQHEKLDGIAGDGFECKTDYKVS